MFKCVLWVLSLVFGGMLLLRKALYQARPPVRIYGRPVCLVVT